jgi:hypothetical protein
MFWPLKGHHQVLGVKIIYSYTMNNSIAELLTSYFFHHWRYYTTIMIGCPPHHTLD